MPRFRLTIEYAGTRYSGWQVQKNARTVQGELQSVLREVLNNAPFELQGSGRTDAGVHALGQVAHLEAQPKMGHAALRDAVNDALPSDVHVLSLEPAAPRFHARHDAVSRSYLYQIARRRTAFGKPYVWWVRDTLSLDRMDRTGQLFVGMHDFRSFTDQKPEKGSTRVLVEGVSLAAAGDLVLIRVQASHFLWKMVRRIVGVMAEVGRGKLELRDVEKLLVSDSEIPARLTAPPSGLFLERVHYRGERRHFPLEPVLRVDASSSAESRAHARETRSMSTSIAIRREAIADLLEKHGGLIYSLGLRFCGDQDEARDLVQDTFLLAFRKWDQFEGRSEASTWLYRIAARACQRRHRRRAGEPRELEPLQKLLPSGEETIVDIPSGGGSPLDLLEQREAREAVEAAVARLPAKFRLPLVLKEIMEVPVEEVARTLGIKENTVKTRLHRARLYLAKALRSELPTREAPPMDHSRRMCLDLLRLKQDALDRGLTFPVPQEELCARCRSLFTTLDLGREACRLLNRGELPAPVKQAVLEAFDRDS